MIPTAAGAYNVRLEDVENENLQSGLQRQIESTSQGSAFCMQSLASEFNPAFTCQTSQSCVLSASVVCDQKSVLPLAYT